MLSLWTGLLVFWSKIFLNCPAANLLDLSETLSLLQAHKLLPFDHALFKPSKANLYTNRRKGLPPKKHNFFVGITIMRFSQTKASLWVSWNPPVTISPPKLARLSNVPRKWRTALPLEHPPTGGPAAAVGGPEAAKLFVSPSGAKASFGLNRFLLRGLLQRAPFGKKILVKREIAWSLYKVLLCWFKVLLNTEAHVWQKLNRNTTKRFIKTKQTHITWEYIRNPQHLGNPVWTEENPKHGWTHRPWNWVLPSRQRWRSAWCRSLGRSEAQPRPDIFWLRMLRGMTFWKFFGST